MKYKLAGASHVQMEKDPVILLIYFNNFETGTDITYSSICTKIHLLYLFFYEIPTNCVCVSLLYVFLSTKISF